MNREKQIERLAMKVMGWHKGPSGYFCWETEDHFFGADFSWDPFSNLKEAFQVLKKIGKISDGKIELSKGRWGVNFDPISEKLEYYDSLPEAISNAALKWLDEKEKEMNRLEQIEKLAVEVMGWEKHEVENCLSDCCGIHFGDRCGLKDFDPFANLEDAFQLVEKVGAMSLWRDSDGEWSCRVGEGKHKFVHSKTNTEAITLAVLEWLKIAKCNTENKE